MGRSKIKRTIGILIKNNATRKRIVDAQKELKMHSIPDIKHYLREHNLIKIGNDAPNDILRKLYETTILSGDITNVNTNTIIHNLSKNEFQDDFSNEKNPMEDIFSESVNE